MLIGRRSLVRGRAFSAEQFLRETAPPLDGLSYKGQGGRVTELKNLVPINMGPTLVQHCSLHKQLLLVLAFACFVSSFPFILGFAVFDRSTWEETQRSAAAGVAHAGILGP